MARIRTIKPDFWTSAQVIECSTNARLLFIGLLNFCDDSGRHPLSAKQCKAEVFPADDMPLSDIEAMLSELISQELIVPYEHGNKRFFYVSGWKHQKIDKPQPSKYPCPFDEHSSNILGTFVPDSKGKDSKGKEGKGVDTHMSTCVDVWNAKAEQLKESGKTYATIRGLTSDRKQKLRARLSESGWLEVYQDAVARLPIRQWNNWVPSFDWMIANGRNAFKLAEGEFHKATYTQSDKNAQIIEDWTPGDLTRELLGGSGQGTSIDASAVRRIPARADTGST